MADIAVLTVEIDNLKDKCSDAKTALNELSNEVGGLSDNVHGLRIWRDGNGGKGAEVRLQAVEKTTADLKACIERVSSDENVERIARVAVKGVIENAKTRDKTIVSKVKAFAPYFAAACALAAAIVAAVL